MSGQVTPPAHPESGSGKWKTDPLIGGMIGGRYRVKGVLGRGGMGVVYEAQHDDLGRSVAIKVVGTEHANDTKVIDRFLREARVVGQIGHPNIVAVHDLGRLEDQRPYLVMERIYGPSFYELLQLHGRMEPARVAELLEGIGNALEVVHSKGIVHRDIKLENLMLARLEDGSTVVKLLDFGIAAFSQHVPDAKRITAQGMITGTPLYIAPEAASGDRPDHRADIYSLAVVAYMMLTGTAPFDSENPVMVLLKKLSEPAPRLSRPGGLEFSDMLEEVIARGLSRKPATRYQSARDFVGDIKNASHAPGAVVLPPSSDAPQFIEPAPRFIEPAHAPRFIEPAEVPKMLEPRVYAEVPLAPTPVAPKPEVAPTAELVRASGAGPFQRMMRAAIYALPLALVVAVIVVVRALRDPSPELPVPVAVEGPAKVPANVPAKVVPAVLPEAPPPVPQEVAETKVVEPLQPELAETKQAAKKKKVVRDEKPEPPPRKLEPPAERAPSVTVPRADVARAEEATRAGTKALIAGLLPSAIESFREATIAAPRHAPAWRGLGLANEKMGRRSEALEAFQHYLKLAAGEDPGVVHEIEQHVEKLKTL